VAVGEIIAQDGTRLSVRPIESDDKAALTAAFARLSAESRYRRFFAPRQRLNETDLRYLTEVDHSDHEALVAFLPSTGEAIGVARYVRSEDPTVAEVAVTVADDWHHKGVATALIELLVVRAREEGIERFLALVLSENEAAVELFKALAVGDAEPKRGESGHLELVIDLPEGDSISGTDLGSALRSAASDAVEINPWRLLLRQIQATVERGWTADEEADSE
jgi:RimJ/RimL family protein N-acetyltransferase